MVISFIALLSAVSISSANSSTLDCEGGIVSAGDTRVICSYSEANPTLKDLMRRKSANGSIREYGEKLFMIVEDWAAISGRTGSNALSL